jgi:hypothetical protein
MMIAAIDVRSRGSKPVRLWLPMFLIWLAIVPIALILSPLILLALAVCRLNPFTAAAALISLVIALSGTRVEVDTPDAKVNIRLI